MLSYIHKDLILYFRRKKMEEKEVSNSEKIGYSEKVKGLIINALEEGKSFLQKDRSGIDYSQNVATGAVYNNANQLFLQQTRINEGYKSPFFLTVQQASDKGAAVKNGSKGAIISYYADILRYHRDEYPLVDGKPDMSLPPIGKKGEPRLDDNGQPYGGHD